MKLTKEYVREFIEKHRDSCRALEFIMCLFLIVAMISSCVSEAKVSNGLVKVYKNQKRIEQLDNKLQAGFELKSKMQDRYYKLLKARVERGLTQEEQYEASVLDGSIDKASVELDKISSRLNSLHEDYYYVDKLNEFNEYSKEDVLKTLAKINDESKFRAAIIFIILLIYFLIRARRHL